MTRINDDGTDRQPVKIDFRAARADDAAHLAVLADAATRHLKAWSWAGVAEVGQSSFEVGREIIRADDTSLSHHAH